MINNPNDTFDSYIKYEEEMEKQMAKIWPYKSLWDGFDEMEEMNVTNRKISTEKE